MRKKLNNISISGWFNIAVLTIFIILLGIFFCGMPKYYDDYSYQQTLAPWYVSQGIYDITEGGDILNYGIPWDSIYEMWHGRAMVDNVRLGNILIVLLLMLPKWLGGLISLSAWVIAMILSFKLAGVEIKSSALVSLAIIIWGIFLPWQSAMAVLDFQFNYILPTALSLILIYKFRACLSPSLQRSKKVNTVRYPDFIAGAGYLFLGIIIGWWHEGFSIPVAAGLIFLCAAYRNFRNYKIYCSILGLVVGIVVLALAPGTAVRLHAYHSTIISKFINTFAFNLPYFFFIAFVWLAARKSGFRQIRQNKLLMFCMISGLIPILMGFATFVQARVTWFTQILSVIGIMYLFQEYLTSFWKSYNLRNLLLILPFLILVLGRFAVADIYVFKARKVFSQSIDRYIKNPDKTIFSDVKTGRDFPMITGNLPDILFPVTMVEVAHFLGHKTGVENFAVIPDELQYVKRNSGMIVSPQGVRLYRGRLFLPAEHTNLKNYKIIDVKVDYGLGVRNVPAYPYHFKSEADDNEYVYLNLIEPWLDSHISEIKSLELPNP